MASYFRQVPNFDYVSRNPGDKYISEYIPVKNLFKRGKLREDIFANLQFFEKYQIIGDERPDNVAFKVYNDSTLDWIILLSNNILNIQTEWPMTQYTFDKVMLERYGSYNKLYSGIHHYETKKVSNSLGVTILKDGIVLKKNQWKTNGNFTEVINTKISQIFSGNGRNPSKTITVTMNNGISGLAVGDEITITNVSENIYNGRFRVESTITPFENRTVSFTYELDSIPDIASPILSSNQKEEVLFTLRSNSEYNGNSYYYEFYDENLGQLVQIPSTEFLNPITNYDYENRIQEEKRNIYILKPRYLSVIFNDMEDIMPYKRGSQQYISENLKRGDNIRLYE